MSQNTRVTVLVVDDEPKNVTLLTDLLESRNYTVCSAQDGEQGLALARDRLPDVVLLDVMMPRLNGFEVCRRLKGEQKTAMIPVLLVTALDARQDRLAGIEAGANDFITKPVDAADLVLRVRNAAATRRLHDRVATQLRQLQELEVARDTLTHMIVHDLRSPLTGLQGYLDLLRMVVDGNAEALEYASEAQIIASRLTEMISQVLDVSRMEAHQMPLSLTDTDLVALLQEAVASLGPPPSGITVAYETPELPVTLKCDTDLISRVVVNLVGNAFKFTPSGGRVRLGLASEVDRVRMTVTDNGPGIPPEFRGRVFEKFGQAPLGQSSGARSSGIGLTFCKLAVEAHGGRIGLEAAEDGGARFWVELFRTNGNVDVANRVSDGKPQPNSR
jgi:two-component system, sensor histidine kinase and response regulator